MRSGDSFKRVKSLIRALAMALQASVGLGAVALLAWGRPGVAAVAAGALAVAGGLPRLARRMERPFGEGLRLVWLLPFAAAWGLGEGGRLFERLRWWDLLTHGLGGLAVGAVAAAWAAPSLRGRRKTLALLAFAAAAAVGAIWEAGEFASDRILGTATQGGAEDSASDLAADLAGGAAAALACTAGNLGAAPGGRRRRRAGKAPRTA